MRYNYKIAMVLIFAIMSISTGVAFADDKLKGHVWVCKRWQRKSDDCEWQR